MKDYALELYYLCYVLNLYESNESNDAANFPRFSGGTGMSQTHTMSQQVAPSSGTQLYYVNMESGHSLLPIAVPPSCLGKRASHERLVVIGCRDKTPRPLAPASANSSGGRTTLGLFLASPSWKE